MMDETKLIPPVALHIELSSDQIKALKAGLPDEGGAVLHFDGKLDLNPIDQTACMSIGAQVSTQSNGWNFSLSADAKVDVHA